MAVIDIEDAPDAVDRLALRIEAASKFAAGNVARRAAREIREIIIPGLGSKRLDDRGTYKQSWRAMWEGGEPYLTNTARHGIFIEKGVPAARVKTSPQMIANLAAWAQRKGIPRPKGKTYVDVAWAIAQTLAGTEEIAGTGIFRGGAGYHILGEWILRFGPDAMREELLAALEEKKALDLEG